MHGHRGTVDDIYPHCQFLIDLLRGPFRNARLEIYSLCCCGDYIQ